MKCPNCGSDKVTYSHTRGVEKITRHLWPKAPYRCKECWTRFWKFKSPMKIIAGSGVAVITLLCLAAAIWFIFLREQQETQQPRFSEEFKTEEKEIFREEKEATVPHEDDAFLADKAEQTRAADKKEMSPDLKELQKEPEQPVISDKEQGKDEMPPEPEPADEPSPADTEKPVKEGTVKKETASSRSAGVSKA